MFPHGEPIEPPTIKKTIDALEQIKTHRFFIAAVGLQACSDYTICVIFLQNLAMGKPPSAAQIDRFSVFFKKVLARMGLFCSCAVKEKSAKGLFFCDHLCLWRRGCGGKVAKDYAEFAQRG